MNRTTASHTPQFAAQDKETRNSTFPAMPDSAAHSVRQEQASPKILVVEDEHLIALEMESTLIDAGFSITGIAVSASEAISLARSTKPDLVIMDIRLAGVRDGVDAALELFREDGIRCVFATAHQDHNTRSRAQSARPLGWLAKPYRPDALVRAVRDALTLLDEK